MYDFLIWCFEEPYKLTIYVHDNENVIVALCRGHREEVHGDIGEWVQWYEVGLDFWIAFVWGVIQLARVAGSYHVHSDLV